MSREIIFRGKRIDNGEWAYGGYYRFSDGRIAILTHRDIGCQYWTSKQQIDRKTVGQFTGLKDKNGKEIFEGDIVEIGSEINVSFNQYEVAWEGWGFAIRKRPKEGNGKKSRLVNRAAIECHSRVIGNIYEKVSP